MNEWLDTLNQQLNQLKQLQELLAQERLALEKRQIKPLSQLVEQKQLLLVKIAELDQQLTTHPDFETLQEQHAKELEEVRRQLENCQKENAVNGEIIERSLSTTNRLSQLLTRLQHPDTMTYSKKGTAQGGTLSGKGIKA
ncbi:flagellar protein FlgN [Dongshaea marina]|uniref:flagellar protein FlgN n=1 Tax=Dongshaea marina TaxID=2047966 RepID=UPI000D3E78A3|nr:flagellar protein FlgN [Dongshaea marina]